jgi:hypothetical protein
VRTVGDASRQGERISQERLESYREHTRSEKPIGPPRKALGSAMVAEDASQFIPLLQQAAETALNGLYFGQLASFNDAA